MAVTQILNLWQIKGMYGEQTLLAKPARKTLALLGMYSHGEHTQRDKELSVPI
jgi:hypothetical protein